MLSDRGRVRRREVQVTRGGTVFHDAVRGRAGAPANGGGSGGPVLQVGAARQGLALGGARKQSQKGQDCECQVAFHVGWFFSWCWVACGPEWSLFRRGLAEPRRVLAWAWPCDAEGKVGRGR